MTLRLATTRKAGCAKRLAQPAVYCSPRLTRQPWQVGLFRLNLEGAYSLAVLEDCYDVGAAGGLAEAYFLEFA